MYEYDFLDSVFEMANLPKDRTGLPGGIWVDSMGKQRKGKDHKPRIKVEDENKKLIPMSIDKTEPKILVKKYRFKSDAIQKFQKFIIKNYDVLMMHWNNEIDDYALLDALIKSSKVEDRD